MYVSNPITRKGPTWERMPKESRGFIHLPTSLTGQSQQHGKHLAFWQGHSRACWKSVISRISADTDLKLLATVPDSLSKCRMFLRMMWISNEIGSCEIWRWSTTALSLDIWVDVKSILHFHRHIRHLIWSPEWWILNAGSFSSLAASPKRYHFIIGHGGDVKLCFDSCYLLPHQ